MSVSEHEPGYAIPHKPPPEALDLAPDLPRALDRGALALAVCAMAVTAAIDNMRAPLLPPLAARAGLAHTGSAAFIAAGSLGAFLMTLASARLLLRWPQRHYLAFAASIQLAAGLAAAAAGGRWGLMAAGLLWGAGNCGLGLSANLYAIAAAPERLRGRTISALHIFYGVAAMAPGVYVPWALAAMPFAAALLLPFALSALPVLWGYARRRVIQSEQEHDPRRGGFGFDAVLLVVGLGFYVLGEVLISVWVPSFFVARGASLAKAGAAASAFFAGLAGGRLAMVLLLRPHWERGLALAGVACGAAAALALSGGQLWAAALTGFCVGPVFPLTTSTLVGDYPQRYRTLLAYNYTFMMLLLAAGHQGFGWLADRVGIAAAFRAPLACFGVAFVCFAARWARR